MTDKSEAYLLRHPARVLSNCIVVVDPATVGVIEVLAGSWILGVLESWSPGFLESWSPGDLEFWSPEVLES